MRPSFIAAGINGLLLMIVVIFTLIYWGTIGNYEKSVLLSLIGLQIGVHALLHHVEEIYYDYNPLENKWTPIGSPHRP